MQQISNRNSNVLHNRDTEYAFVRACVGGQFILRQGNEVYAQHAITIYFWCKSGNLSKQ